MKEFWEQWEWLLWLMVGGVGAWAVLKEVYTIRPLGQGRQDSDYDSKWN